MRPSLPRYPDGPVATEAPVNIAKPRGERLLIDLVWLAGIAALLWWASWARDSIEQPSIPPGKPFDFPIVEKNFAAVQIWGHATREDVEQLLGPPTEFSPRTDELRQIEEDVLHGARGFAPEQRSRIWHKWRDPADPRRWVAVLYDGPGKSARVWAKTKRGF